jgi:acyl-CoA dehydrogenase
MFNPNTYDPQKFDPETRRQLRALIDWFEARGRTKLLQDDLEATWVSDFLDFIGKERIFATFLTPSEFGLGDDNKRWDTSRNAALSEILGFYGLAYSEHAFYEAITHANNRILYGSPVTDFPHVKASFVDVYARIVAMKLFSDRAIDYFRSASLEDRRYLLFNPVTKAKVTSEGETVVRLLWDVLAAKGFERNTYFAEVARLIGALPRLEGTVHVNVAQILKFMPNYLFNPAAYPQIGTRDDPADDVFFWAQGPARGASKVQFADWAVAYEKASAITNVGRFAEQARALQQLLATAAPDAEQQRDLDFMLVVGHLFTLVVYGQLILEQAEILGLEADLVDQIFDVQVRDFSAYAVALHGKSSSTAAQEEWALGAVRKPVPDADRFERVWRQVKSYDGAYQMRP